MRSRLLTLVLLLSSAPWGCSICKREQSVTGQTEPVEGTSSSAGSTGGNGVDAPPDPVHGLWSQRPFLVQSAVVNIHPHWITITLLNREARCDSARLAENDMGVQMEIPSGPDNDFFAGRDMPLELRLHGAGGVSRIPAGHVTARLDPFDPSKSESVKGYLSFRYKTALDPDAPAYNAEGPFTARVCNNLVTKPSIASFPGDKAPVSGSVAKREVQFRTMQAYLRSDGYGGQIVMLKGFELDVPCHTTRSATPYLFGVEIGPGKDGTYFAGKRIPTDWIMQMRMQQFSERSVHAAHGASWVQIDSVETKEGGIVRGRLGADNSEDDPEWRFSLSGRFEATVCGIERKAW